MDPRFFWKLIFQSGALAGRSLHLPNGDITIGETPDCDVQLPLPKAAGQHCVLRVSEQGVRLRTLQVRCRMNGRRIRNDDIEIANGQRLELGGCRLSIARAGEHAVLQPAKRGANRLHLWGIALPSAMATCLMAVLLQAGHDLRASVPQYMPFNLHSYQRAVQKKFGRVKVERDESGILKLSGLCPDTTALTPYLNTLTDAGITYQNQVVCEDELRRSVVYILRGNGYRYAHVTSGQEPGSVIIAGNISDDSRWASVGRQLDQLSGLKSWTVHNDVDATIASLIDALRQPNLFKQLSVTYQGDVLTVTGQIPEEREFQLRQVLERWRQERQNSIRVVYQNIPASKLEGGLFPAQVVSLSGSQDAAFLKLANGMRIQAGSALPSGYTVTKLDQDGIELRKEGQWVHLPLGL